MRLTTITPNFIHSHVLEDAVRAIAQQSPPPDEFIFVDDGSTDDGLALLRRLSNDLSFRRLFEFPDNRGTYNDVQHALRVANGDVVHLAAADDLILPGMYARLMNALETFPLAAFASGEARVVDLQTRFVGWRPPARPSRQVRYFWPTKAVQLLRRIDNWTVPKAAVIKRHHLSANGGFDKSFNSFGNGFLF